MATKPPLQLLLTVAVAAQVEVGSVRSGPPMMYGSRVPCVSLNRNQYSVSGDSPPIVTAPERSGPVRASATGLRHWAASSRLVNRLTSSGGS
ncbi:hypothetical protein [Micromonospora sp. NBS 11-29]|uniref:hypothetical protein n=1 Tax=Micromonospora sp. NBS 11-29 TaxID=1960879 RepID=UPI0020CFAD95|nr:hypothetical protein [Micromonospora sp. NBS 11-29]